MEKGLRKVREAEGQKGGEIPPDDILQQFGIEGKEQKIFEMYLGNGMQIIHGRETRDQVIERIRPEDPERSLADAVSLVMDKLDASAKEARQGVPEMVRALAGITLLGQLAQVAEAAGIAKFDDDAKILALSKLLASQLAKGMRAGKYNPQELKQAAQEAAAKLKIDPAAGMAKIAQGMPAGKNKGA